MVRVAVVGGGILGTSIAHLLSSHDGFEVHLYEKGQLFGMASGMAAGILTFQLYLEHDVKLTRATLAYYSRLGSQGYNVLRRVGGISLYDTSIDRGCLQLMTRKLGDWGCRYKVLSPGDLEERLPGIRVTENLVGLETDCDYIVDSGELQNAIREKLAENGVEIYENTGVAAVEEEENAIVYSSVGAVEYAYIVLSMGPWNIRILGLEGKVFQYHCQAHSIKFAPPSSDTSIYDYTDGIYVVPESPNRVIVGDGCKPLNDPGEGLVPDDRITLHIAETLSNRFPGSAEAELASVWSAPCDVAMDGLPYVGRVPGSRRIIGVGGLDGYGIMRGPGLASIIEDYLVLGEPFPGIYRLERLYAYPRPSKIVVNELYNPGCGHRNPCIFEHDSKSDYWAP